MLIGVGVSFCILYSIVSYLYVSCSRSITSVGEERANLSAIAYLLLCGFCSERFPLPLGALDGLRYFIVALPGPSIYFCTLCDFHMTLNNSLAKNENSYRTKPLSIVVLVRWLTCYSFDLLVSGCLIIW